MGSWKSLGWLILQPRDLGRGLWQAASVWEAVRVGRKGC